jgi:hypothetical protein
MPGALSSLWLAAALAAEPDPSKICLDRECAFCLLGQPVTSPAMQAAVTRFGLTQYREYFHGSRGMFVDYSADGRVSAVTHQGSKCWDGGCIAGMPYGLADRSSASAIEAALPGGAWVDVQGTRTWRAAHEGLVVEVQVDDQKELVRVVTRSAPGGEAAVRQTWCREGSYPGRLPSEGTVAADPDDPLLAAAGSYLQTVDLAAVAAGLDRARAALEAQAADPRWKAVAEHRRRAIEAVGLAIRWNSKATTWFVEGVTAASGDPRRAAFTNARGELISSVTKLGEAVGHLERAAAAAEGQGLADEAARLAGRREDLAVLHRQLDSIVQKLPSAAALEEAGDRASGIILSVVDVLLKVDGRLVTIGMEL